MSVAWDMGVQGVFVCVGLLLTYLIGHVVAAPFMREPHQPFRRCFTKLTLGMTVLVTGYAVTMTTGRTILFSLSLIGMYCLYTQWRAHGMTRERVMQNVRRIELLPWCIAGAVALGVLCLQQYQLGFPGQGALYAIHPDQAFYARIAQYLNQYRIESNSLDWVFLQGQAPNPYHYIDIWMVALASKLCAMNTVYAAKCVVIPLVCSVIYTGAVALIEKFTRVSWKTYVVGLAIFVVASFAWLFQLTLANVVGGDVYQHTLMTLPKLSLIYIYMLWAVLLFQASDVRPAIMVLATLGIIYPLTMPSVYGAAIITMWYAYLRRDVTLGTACATMLLMGSIVAYFLVFYGVAHTEHSYAVLGSTDAAVTYYGSVHALVTGINIIGSTVIKILVTNLPYVIVLGWVMARSTQPWSRLFARPATVFCLLLSVLPLLAWSVLHFMYDSVQLWYVIYFPLVGIGGYLLIGMILHDARYSRALKMGAVAILLLNVYAHPMAAREERLNHSFYARIAEAVSAVSQPKFAYIKAESEYMNSHEKSPTFMVPLPVLLLYTETYLPVSLSVYDTPMSESIYERHREESMIQASPFYRFVEQQKRNHTFVSLPDSQVAFIKTFEIQYLILSKDAGAAPLLEALYGEVIEDVEHRYTFIKLNI